MKQRMVMVFVALILAVSVTGQESSTYPYTASELTGPEIIAQTCAGWGLTAPVGATSCATTTITRTASASDPTISNSGTVALGATYTTTFAVTRSAGSVIISAGGVSGTVRTTSATFTQLITTASTDPVTFTFSADFAGTIATTVSAKRVKGSATYNPTIATTPYSATVAGGAIPEDAVEAVVSVESYPIRYLYNANPTASVGVLLPAGWVGKWGPSEIAKFRAIRFIDTAAGASTVTIVYAKGSE